MTTMMYGHMVTVSSLLMAILRILKQTGCRCDLTRRRGGRGGEARGMQNELPAANVADLHWTMACCDPPHSQPLPHHHFCPWGRVASHERGRCPGLSADHVLHVMPPKLWVHPLPSHSHRLAASQPIQELKDAAKPWKPNAEAEWLVVCRMACRVAWREERVELHHNRLWLNMVAQSLVVAEKATSDGSCLYSTYYMLEQCGHTCFHC